MNNDVLLLAAMRLILAGDTDTAQAVINLQGDAETVGLLLAEEFGVTDPASIVDVDALRALLASKAPQ